MIRGVARKRGAPPAPAPVTPVSRATASQPSTSAPAAQTRRRPGELLEQRARKSAIHPSSSSSVRRRVPKKKKVDVSAVIDRLVDELVDMEL